MKTGGHKLQGKGMSAVFPLRHPADWVDPASGLAWSRDPLENLRQRRALTELGSSDPQAAAIIRETCRKSYQFWSDHFGWSLHVRSWGADGKAVAVSGESACAPWINWPVNDGFHETIEYAVQEQQAIACPKAREMRATWHAIMYMTWLLMFRSNTSMGTMSYVDDLANSKNPDSHRERIKFVLDKQPDFFDSAYDFSDRTLRMRHNNSTVTFFANTENASVSMRLYLFLIDEAARIEALENIENAIRDSSFAQLYISTPLGATHFQKVVQNAPIVFPMGYASHPEKGIDRRWCVDPDGSYTGTRGRGFWDTPYFERERKVRSIRSIQENLLIDFASSNRSVFDLGSLQMQIAVAKSNPPHFMGDIIHDFDGAERDLSLVKQRREHIRLVKGRGPLKIWGRFEAGRLPQDTDYVIAADVSNGIGSSNSVAKIYDVRGELVAEWADARTDPAEFARRLAMLSLWVGGLSKTAMVGHENNGGQGGVVSKFLKELSVARVYGDGGEIGWRTTRDNKAVLAEELRNAWSSGRLVEHSVETLQEAMDWVYSGATGVGPAVLRQDIDASGTHGDRVIASMIGWMLVNSAQAGMKKPEIAVDPEFAKELEVVKRASGKGSKRYKRAS